MDTNKAVDLLATSGDPGDEQDNAEARLGEYFGRMPSDASVGIYEVDPDNARKTSFLFPLPADELPAPAELFAEILENCGPGTYEAFAQEKGGKIICKQRFSVGSMREQRRPRVPNLRARRDAEAPAPASTAPASSMPPELVQLLQNQQRLLETIVDRLNQAPAPAAERGVLEIARELKELQGLFVPQQPQPVQGVAELVQQFLTIRDSLREETESESSPFAAAIKHLAPAITNAVDKLAEGRETERAAALSRAAEAAQHDPGAPPADVPANGYAAMLSRYLSPLVEMAERKEQPERAAQWVLQTLAQQPDAIAEAVLDFLDDQESVRKLVAIEPKFAPHAEWLEATIQAVMHALDAQQAEADAATTAPAQQPTPTKGEATGDGDAASADSAGG